MTENYKEILGVLAVAIAVISYIPYFRNIFSGKTKPHAFTWLTWGMLNAIAFAGQLYDDAGPGAWAVGFTALAMFVIFGLALKKGEKNIKPFDWYSLVGSLIALLIWAITNDPLLSIILITVIDACGFFPTVRKSYNKPFQETAITFTLSTVKYLFVILALSNYTLITVLFPLSLIIMNGLFVGMLVVRRIQIGK